MAKHDMYVIYPYNIIPRPQWESLLTNVCTHAATLTQTLTTFLTQTPCLLKQKIKNTYEWCVNQNTYIGPALSMTTLQ